MLTKILNMSENCSFKDIPKSEDMKQYFKLENSTILKLVDEYHIIEKDKISNIKNRMILLNSIHHKLSNCENEKLNILGMYAKKKKNYLNCLNEMFNREILLPNQQIYNKEKLLPYFENKKDSKSVCIVNEVRFDYKTNTKFGEYWLELIDPSHRLGIDFYKRIWEKDNSNTNFFMWLEKIECFHNIPVINMPSNISQYRVDIRDGLILDCDGNIKDTPSNEEEIFIIDENQNIFSCLSSNSMKHTSLSKGRPLLGVGSFQLEKGKIKYLENSSGHYLPGKKILTNTLEILKNKGINLEINTKIGYFDNASNIQRTTFYNLNNNPRQINYSTR